LAARIARLSLGETKHLRPRIMLRSPSPSDAAAKSGASSANISAARSRALTRLGSGWPPPKSGSGVAVHDRPGRGAEAALQDVAGIGPGDGVHRIEAHPEGAERSRSPMRSKSNRLSISAA
jgi:hypothetical protein